MYQPVPRASEDENDTAVELEELSPEGYVSVKKPSGRDKPKTTWLLIFFLINSVAFGLTAVPRVNLYLSLVCRHYLDSSTSAQPVIIGGMNPQCMTGDMSAKTSMFTSLGTVIVGVFSSIVSPWLGRLSDRVGRIKPMMFNMLGMILCETVIVIIAGAPDIFNYKWLYLAYAIDGLSGSFAAAMSISSAYISDCTEPNKRNVQIGRMHGAMFIGISVGPMLSSVIAKFTGDHSPLLVFYICLVMRGLSVVYLRFIPESLPYATEPLDVSSFRIIELIAAFRYQNIKKRIYALHPGDFLEKLVPSTMGLPSYFKSNLAILMLINVIVHGASMAAAEVLMLYPQVVFKWTNVENNIFMSVINACRAAVSTIALPILVRVFRKPSMHHHPATPISQDPHSSILTNGPPPGADTLDRTLMRLAIFCDACGFLFYAVAPNGVLYTIGGALAAFGAIGLSTTEAAMTKHVDPSHLGLLMGGLGMLQGAVRIFAPGTVNLIYSATASSVPYLAFLVVAGILGGVAGLTWFVRVSDQ